MTDVSASKSVGNAAPQGDGASWPPSLAWPSFYPDHCPPAEAIPAEGIVLRLVCNDPAVAR